MVSMSAYQPENNLQSRKEPTYDSILPTWLSKRKILLLFSHSMNIFQKDPEASNCRLFSGRNPNHKETDEERKEINEW